MSKVSPIDEVASTVSPGSRIAFGGGGALTRRPVEFSRALIRAGAKDLHVHNFLGGIEIDLLIAAHAVSSTSCAYLGLLEHGQAPGFQKASREKEIEVREYSEFSYMAGLRASDLGLPFLPWKTPWGSDMVRDRNLKTIRDPYGGLELLALPATEIDVSVIQVERADADGYVEMPEEPDLVWDYDYLIARVAKTTIICAEEIAPTRNPARVALVGKEVTHVVEAKGGAWPAGMPATYEADVEHLLNVYVPAAEAGGELFDDYLDEFVYKGGRVES